MLFFFFLQIQIFLFTFLVRNVVRSYQDAEGRVHGQSHQRAQNGPGHNLLSHQDRLRQHGAILHSARRRWTDILKFSTDLQTSFLNHRFGTRFLQVQTAKVISSPAFAFMVIESRMRGKITWIASR